MKPIERGCLAIITANRTHEGPPKPYIVPIGTTVRVGEPWEWPIHACKRCVGCKRSDGFWTLPELELAACDCCLMRIDPDGDFAEEREASEVEA